MAVKRRVLRARKVIETIDDAIESDGSSRESVSKELVWLCTGFDRTKIKYYSIFRYTEFIYGDSFDPRDTSSLDLNLMMRLVKVLRRIRDRNKKEGILKLSGISDRTKIDLTNKGIIVEEYATVLDVIKMKNYLNSTTYINTLRDGFKDLIDKEKEYLEHYQLELLLSSLLYRLFGFEESITLEVVRSVNEDFIGFMLID